MLLSRTAIPDMPEGGRLRNEQGNGEGVFQLNTGPLSESIRGILKRLVLNEFCFNKGCDRKFAIRRSMLYPQLWDLSDHVVRHLSCDN
jgi:hypothetical protein